MQSNRITEEESIYRNIEKTPLKQILQDIHKEDLKAVSAINNVLENLSALIEIIVKKLNNKGRLFYIGAGTSGRLGVLDSSECPPTFGVSKDKIIGLIAGGDIALRNSIEKSEDDTNQAWKDLKKYNVSNDDIVLGIAASGTTPYVVSGLKECKENNIVTACITCNPKSPLSLVSDYPIEVIVGPEYISGSSRMKAGTIQKLILNMISTSTMIQLGHVKGNKMIDMQLSNDKLKERALSILTTELKIDLKQADELLKKYNSVRDAIKFYERNR
jgi:N-acetylmuramic acid 6-phosphate etherase